LYLWIPEVELLDNPQVELADSFLKAESLTGRKMSINGWQAEGRSVKRVFSSKALKNCKFIAD